MSVIRPLCILAKLICKATARLEQAYKIRVIPSETATESETSCVANASLDPDYFFRVVLFFSALPCRCSLGSGHSRETVHSAPCAQRANHPDSSDRLAAPFHIPDIS